MSRPSKRETLLAAALALVTEHGYSALTLDAVGAAAGMSKGGVLYHFPTKDALVAALIEQLAAGFAAEQQTARSADSTMPGAATRAYLATAARQPEPTEQQAMVALLAAIGHDPDLLAPLQRTYRRWIDDLDRDDLPGVDAHIVRLAADGLWAADLFGLAPPEPALREAILARLRELAAAAAEGARP